MNLRLLNHIERVGLALWIVASVGLWLVWGVAYEELLVGLPFLLLPPLLLAAALFAQREREPWPRPSYAAACGLTGLTVGLCGVAIAGSIAEGMGFEEGVVPTMLLVGGLWAAGTWGAFGTRRERPRFRVALELVATLTVTALGVIAVALAMDGLAVRHPEFLPNLFCTMAGIFGGIVLGWTLPLWLGLGLWHWRRKLASAPSNASS